MLTIKIHKAHDLRVEEEPDATPPGQHEVTVTISRGGICGSDLHYYHQGGFGQVRLREPMTLGHEVSGMVSAVGDGVTDLRVDDKVAINPSIPCEKCTYCHQGLFNQCDDMRFFGSAMRFPHQQGLFRQTITIDRQQLVALPGDIDLTHAACAEPLAVCLHAVGQAGALEGKRVLISGCGPIGCLTAMLAAHAGAKEVIVTDMHEAPLKIARQMGAMRTINVSSSPEELQSLAKGKGALDVIIECSGSPQALGAALEVVRPRGTIVTVGLGGAVNLEMNLVVAKEINIKGTFRFDKEFKQAVELIGSKRINVAPLITSVLPMANAEQAFELAARRDRAMKVQIDFENA
ncbi:L-idonate 5-dehydrogenase [Halomonas sp. 86]|uniref:L-idonate 5-dehydrogenase n=1 Tax=unclassified Halomonas TaxID=2609666 RepID=UPI004033F627